MPKSGRHLGPRVVNIKRVLDGRVLAEGLQKTVVGPKELAGFDPADAAYVYTQNQVSVLSEQLTSLNEMAPFGDIISRAEDLYVPSAPPMSPLTTSYFTCWAFFDACVVSANDTIGTTVLEFGTVFSMHIELLRLRFPARFRKSLVLFNLHRAAAESKSVIVVEGFFDCFNLHQAGCLAWWR